MKRTSWHDWLFHLTALFAVAFVLTVLALIAGVFGDPEAPANVWLNQYATWLLLIEVGLIALSGLAAMVADQRSRSQPVRAETQPAKSPPE